MIAPSSAVRARTTCLVATTTLALALSSVHVHAQASPYVATPQYVPFGSANVSPTLEIDFGDTDNDGDWDALLANGGEWGPHQDRLWCNMAGVQGGQLGTFLDGTIIHMPQFSMPTTDVELGDIDGDGDEDVYWVAQSLGSDETGRFWANQGGMQGGSISFFVDDNHTRWSGLGASGSSIPAADVLPTGGFKSYSVDAQFFDFDDDGDLDLLHSSFGVGHDGRTPIRIFRNDGLGVFEEFNPSGHQLSGPALNDGEPALWCAGLQAEGTLDVTGASADVTGAVVDVEVGDLDGDFDLDVLVASEGTRPRAYANGLRASVLGAARSGGEFQDVTATVFANWSVAPAGGGDLELVDWDADGDLDLFGLDWGVNGEDVLLTHGATGVFDATATVLGANGVDHAELDLVDYDNDGLLDVYACRRGSDDHVFPHGALGAAPLTSPYPGDSDDVEVSDVDGDGDWDLMVAAENFGQNMLLTNTTDVGDTTPPRCSRIEAVTWGAPTEPVVVHGTVSDNAPAYTVRGYGVSVPVFVGGCKLGEFPATWSGGELFRAELPGNLVGDVSYRFRAVDLFDNVGGSAFVNVTVPGPAFQTAFGTASPSPLGDPEVLALSLPVGGETFWLGGRNAPANAIAVLVLAPQALPSPVVLPGLLTLNVFGNTWQLFHVGRTDANGCLVTSLPLPAGFAAGQSSHAQFFAAGGTTQVFASSLGLTIVSQ